ncbi:MAG: PD40 domain-containing protein [Bdellovibrionales bacterium]|nr:PD40 domain-containing protein [Bdellovibrionales bacterium]
MKKWFSYGWITAALIFSAQVVFAQVYIDVGKAKVKKSTLAIPPLVYFGSDSSNLNNIRIGQTLYRVIKDDMDVSNFFVLQSPNAFLDKSNGLRPAPGDPGGFQFSNWSSIGTEFLIKGGYKVIGRKVTLEVYAYAVGQVKLVLGKQYEGTTDTVRQMAHKFSDDLILALTGKRGMFNTKFVVTANRDGKFKEIYIMDWDGEDVKRVTKFKGLSISPAWSPDAKKVAFTNWAYHKKAKTRNADLFLYELSSGKIWLISHKKGINSGAAFHPNNKDLYFTISKTGTPDIYRMNMSSETTYAITKGPGKAMNVEPDISPDGKLMAFSSDRSGSPMVYVSTIYGANIRRLTFGGRYNASPSWSPDGKKLAFAGFAKDHFDIFIIDVESKQMKRLTQVRKKNGKWADNESPTFSPDGRFIAFTSNRSGTNQIYIVSVDGLNERRITNDSYHYEKPKWSPYFD